MKKWLSGIPYEVAFWESVYSNDRTFQSVMRFSHLGSPLSLNGFDAAAFLLAQPDPGQATILDVGCGMTFYPGDYLLVDGEKLPLDIHYIDPLAEYYNRIARKTGRKVPQVEFGMMDYLSAFYPEHNVSLVIIQNALDHSANPMKGILEALNALKTGGVLYLNHHPNEAEYEDYRGFHQFNVMVENGDMIIWNRTERFNVNELLKDFATVETSLYEGNPVAVITRTDAVPAELLDMPKDIRTLSEALLGFSQQVNSPSAMLAYHCRFFWFRLAQHFSKLFSWSTRQKIKQHLKKITARHTSKTP